MECSPGTKGITEKQVLKASDTLIWKREELRLTRPQAARRLSSTPKVGSNSRMAPQRPGQGAWGLALSGSIVHCSDLKRQLEQEHPWERSHRGAPFHGESVQLGHDHSPCTEVGPAPSIEKAVLNTGLCTSSSLFSVTRSCRQEAFQMTDHPFKHQQMSLK